jgi:hypothetical protein
MDKAILPIFWRQDRKQNGRIVENHFFLEKLLQYGNNLVYYYAEKIAFLSYLFDLMN